jgi:hypothetical protein
MLAAKTLVIDVSQAETEHAIPQLNSEEDAFYNTPVDSGHLTEESSLIAWA